MKADKHPDIPSLKIETGLPIEIDRPVLQIMLFFNSSLLIE